MINRELIRIKVVQLVYANSVAGEALVAGGARRTHLAMENELLKSLDKANDLYYHLLRLIPAITSEAARRYEVYANRALREGTPPPSNRFVRNRFAAQLAENARLELFAKERKLDWQDDRDLVRHLLNTIEQSAVYRDYLSAEDEPSYADDRELWRWIYRYIIVNNDALDALLEEQSIYWNDDKMIVDTFVLKTIKRFEEMSGAEQELLPDYKDDDDVTFAKRLLTTALDHWGDYQQEFVALAGPRWQVERMPLMDVVIIVTAMAEMRTFIEIPASVTINEYIEIAKMYSTAKSPTFINAVLDKVRVGNGMENGERRIEN